MMQSVGEVMAIGRTFPESLQKALRSLETGRWGLNCDPTEREYDAHTADELVQHGACTPHPSGRSSSMRRCGAACRSSASTKRPASTPGSWSTWRSLGDLRAWLSGTCAARPVAARVAAGEARGLLATRSSRTCGTSTKQVVYDGAERRRTCQVTYKTVDTCAAEFAAQTPYHYGTYEDEDEVAPLARPAVVILGQRSQPHRSGGRVRLLLRARRVRALRRRLRDGDAQLQPRDRLHRLRHQRPPLLRAALPRGRARGVPPAAGTGRPGRW